MTSAKGVKVAAWKIGKFRLCVRESTDLFR